jgi:inner membrane protein involved in colicin E2 resistance
MDVSYHLEVWQIAAICLLMLPLFFLVNYVVVKRMIQERKVREDRVERFVAASVARDMSPENRSKMRPKKRF